MITSIGNPVEQTWIFTILLGVALILSIRRDKNRNFFPISTTEELKGFAILAVVFAHVGYFLVADHRFLYPLSIVSGVGVDLFLFLSGFGLTISSLKKGASIAKFYLKRLPRLFIPFWIVLIIFLILDFLILKISYPWQSIISDFLGIFTRADIYKDVNSPFWYFTIILFYYLIYPLVFTKKMPWFSALIIYIISYLIIFQWNPGFISQVRGLYETRLLPFPLGIIFAWGYYERNRIRVFFADYLSRYKEKDKKLFALISKISQTSSIRKIKKNVFTSFRYLLMTGLLFLICYTAVNSGVGNPNIVGYISIVTVLAIFLLFILKKFDFKLLSLIGVYSYEIYLLHWPIMSRYDFLFRNFSGWLAMSLYLVLLLALAWILQKITNRFLKPKDKKA